MGHEHEAAAPTAVGNFHLSQDMPNGRKMDMSCYLLAGETVADLNQRIDDAMAVMERQRRRLEIPLLEAALEKDKEGLANQLDAFNALLERAKGNGKRLTSSEQTHVQTTYPANIKALKERIERGEAEIAKAKAGAA